MVMTTVQIAGYFGMMNWLPTIIQTSLKISVKDSSLWMVTTILGMCIGMLVFGQILEQIWSSSCLQRLFTVVSSLCILIPVC